MDAKLIEKLRKVQALTSSPDEGEAAAAANMLRRLLVEHNLEISDLEARGEAARPGVEERERDEGAALFRWKRDLASGLAPHYFCAPLVRDLGGNRGSLTFVGRPDNVDALLMLYGWLVDQVKEIARKERRAHQERTGEHVDPLRWQLHFGLGAVQRLVDRVEERARRQAEESAKCTALVVSHATEVSDYLEKEYGFRADGQPTAKEREERAARDAQIARWRAETAEWEALRERDPEAAYKLRPWERPAPELTEAEKAERAKREAKDRARRAKEDAAWRRRQQRRDEAEARRERSPEARRRREQARRAEGAGYSAADRINLEPFIEGPSNDDEPKRLGGGE